MNNKLLEALGQKLVISDSHSVQPNILLRTPLFSPTSTKFAKLEGVNLIHDVTEELRHIQIFEKEGYQYASIKGEQLNVRTDFRIWCGVIRAFSKYGYDTDNITLSLSEFVKFCGFETRVLNKAFRVRLEQSLGRIKSQTVSFKTSAATKSMATSLIKKFTFDIELDEIKIQGDPELWELYRIDHQILVNIQTLSAIPRAETAQCLYLYFSSLPENPFPVTLSRLRNRINSASADKREINKSIKMAIQKLETIGYLNGYWIKFQGEQAYMIEKRIKKLHKQNI